LKWEWRNWGGGMWSFFLYIVSPPRRRGGEDESRRRVQGRGGREEEGGRRDGRREREEAAEGDGRTAGRRGEGEVAIGLETSRETRQRRRTEERQIEKSTKARGEGSPHKGRNEA